MYETWEKIGRIFDPARFGVDWMTTHAQNPMPEPLGAGIYKVYFATRDSQNRSRGAFFVFDITRPFDVLEFSERPLIDLGPLKVTASEEKSIPLPPIVGGVALVAGIALVLVDRKKK